MGKLTIFDFISLNGFYKGPGDDISWNMHAKEETLFSEDRMKNGNSLLFGRVTYEMMAGYWQQEDVIINDPIIAKGMNSAEKFVISKTLDKADWPGTTLLKGDLVEEVKKLKQRDKDITVLGSGSVITQLADAGLIDLYQVMIFPVLLPAGTPVFSNIANNIRLKCVSSKTFKSGTVVLDYEPI